MTLRYFVYIGNVGFEYETLSEYWPMYDSQAMAQYHRLGNLTADAKAVAIL